MTDLFADALTQLSSATKNFPKNLSAPERVITVTFPIKMDNGQTRIFEGYRVQYNNALGPYKGGTRYSSHVTLSEVKALAFWMTFKNAIAGNPMGGGKGAVVFDPKTVSPKELEKITRGYTKALGTAIGPYLDVPGPDLGTNEVVMDWIAKEYKNPAVVTGKSVKNKGSLGRTESTGWGGYYVFETALKLLNLKPKTIAIQGSGNVATYIAEKLIKNKYIVVAVSDSQGGLFASQGLTLEQVKNIKKTKRNITNEKLLELPVDVLIPAALEDQITEKNAGKIKAKLILEMANGPTTPGADKILAKKKVTDIPEILANGGGVTVSYYEWRQNLRHEKWSLTKVDAKLKSQMQSATRAAFAMAKKKHCALRSAAFLLALERIKK
ncbi:Glu/Leu/Phe/Val dehydrogenase [Candidatus Microgenomates bacterium]|nr:Glu/Leu/Phe/Val dehydrogenase [Candidatus Microgenomates bacterium]